MEQAPAWGFGSLFCNCRMMVDHRLKSRSEVCDSRLPPVHLREFCGSRRKPFLHLVLPWLCEKANHLAIQRAHLLRITCKTDFFRTLRKTLSWWLAPAMQHAAMLHGNFFAPREAWLLLPSPFYKAFFRCARQLAKGLTTSKWPTL